MRQIIELETSDQETALDLQRRLTLFCREEMPTLLEQICTGCDNGDRIFRIDKLEVDLGSISKLYLEEDIRQGIGTVLKETLTERVDRLRLFGDPEAKTDSLYASNDEAPQMSKAVSVDRVLSPVDADFELIRYFLSTGVLPWPTPADSVEPLEDKLKRLLQIAPDKIDVILTLVAERPIVRQRMIAQFADELLCRLIRSRASDQAEQLLDWKRDLERITATVDFDNSIAIDLRESFWDTAFQYLGIIPAIYLDVSRFWSRIIGKVAERNGGRSGEITVYLLKQFRRATEASMPLRSNLLVALEDLSGLFENGSDESSDSAAEIPLTRQRAKGRLPVKTSDPVPAVYPISSIHPPKQQLSKKTKEQEPEDRPTGWQDVQPTKTDRDSEEVRSLAEADRKTHIDSAAYVERVRPEIQKKDVEISRTESGKIPPWEEQEHGTTSDPTRSADHCFPEIRFEYRPEPNVSEASEDLSSSDIASIAEPQPSRADRAVDTAQSKTSIPSDNAVGAAESWDPQSQPIQTARRVAFARPQTPISSNKPAGPAESSESSGSFHLADQYNQYSASQKGRPSTGISSPEVYSDFSSRADKLPERQARSIEGYRTGLDDPNTVAATEGALAERSVSALFGSDAKTALQEIYIDNAGMVILWPFLSNLFKKLSLMDNRDFVDRNTKARAVYLLHYLATGEEAFPEYLLPLCKILCGWTIDEPIGREYRLSDQEKTESRELLEAVIGHWAALKRTSVDGLRAGFLKRNAVLIETMQHWLLRVERKPHDILLERLPWGISMIHLSWMKKVLSVEW